jgi:DNA-binding transcriptional MerR regulator
VFTIGEFSKITGMTVKTLRFYHEQSVLAPSYVDAETGYRYYSQSKIEVARIISQLRTLEFSLAEIAEILDSYDDEADILSHLERQNRTITEKMHKFREVKRSLQSIISKEREAIAAMQNEGFEVSEKNVDAMLMAGVRMKGQYSECGKGFSQIGRKFGRQINGKPFLLHYDTEYKEHDADFEACMPIRKGESTEAISVRELPGGRCASLLHKGPYEELGRSYAKILDYVKQQGYKTEIPSREVYIKGPGMIFKGNPKKYVTEIQMLIDERDADHE